MSCETDCALFRIFDRDLTNFVITENELCQ